MPYLKSQSFKGIKYQLLVILLPMITLLGCRELVQDEFPDFTPVPTVNSFLVADSAIKVHVSMAAKLDSLPLKNVDQAEVLLFVDGTFKETLAATGEGMFSSTTIAEAGKSYQCEVKIAGYETARCTDSIPLPNPILKIEHIRTGGIDDEGLTYPAIKFTFSNNTREKRYYEAIIRYYRDISWSTPYWTTAYLMEITDPVLLAEGLPIAVFSNDQIKGDTYTMVLNYSSGSYHMEDNVMVPELFPVILELRSISYNYYLYLKQLYLYNLGRYPEFPVGVGSVFPLHSNVQNGYGIFAGYSTFLSEIIDPE